MQKSGVLLAVLLLPGCAAYQSHPIAPAALQASYESRTLVDPALHDFIALRLQGNVPQWPLRAWDLEELVLAGFYYSPELDVARKKWATSSAAIITAGQRPNPALLLPFEYATNPPSGESPYTLGLGLDIPIETAGKRGYRIAQAQLLSDAARLEVGNVAWHVRGHVRGQLLRIYAATNRATLLESQIQAQHEIVELLEKRLSLGSASWPELNQARIAAAQSRIELSNAQKQLQDARAQLAGVIGIPLNALADIHLDLTEFDQPPAALPALEARRRAILNRADLLSALSQYQASEAALQLEIARQYPDFHLRPGYTFDMGTNKYALSAAGITLPIFNRNEGPIAEAKARRDEIASRVNALQAQAISETDRSLANYDAAAKNLSLADSVLNHQRTQLERLREIFAVGQTDRLALSLAKSLSYVNRLARLDALVQVQEAVGAVEDAMQFPLSTRSAQQLPRAPEVEKR